RPRAATSGCSRCRNERRSPGRRISKPLRRTGLVWANGFRLCYRGAMQRSTMTAVEINQTPAGPFISSPAPSRRAMNWFFAEKERLFWFLQISGWLGFFVFHVLAGSSLGAGWSQQSLAYSLAMSIVGLLTTSIILRPIYRFARRQHPAALLLIGISTTAAATIAMSIAKLPTFVLIFGEEWVLNRGADLG